ncbi:MAG: hypothetical protein ISN28_11720 [Ectothiorhodospiraceae bacterium AqS1]|nr:hypothetical protein [Ectothiorhodospiraceae bacterium AqS1]
MLLLKKIASSNNFGLVAASLMISTAIVASSLVGQVDEERIFSIEKRIVSLEERVVSIEERIVSIEERIVSIEERILSIEKEIVELRLETKTEIAGLKEDIKRIEASQLRLESKIDAFIANQAAGGRAGG